MAITCRTGPEGDFIQRQPLLPHSAKDHGSQPAVADRQRFQPSGCRPPVPQRQRRGRRRRMPDKRQGPGRLGLGRLTTCICRRAIQSALLGGRGSRAQRRTAIARNTSREQKEWNFIMVGVCKGYRERVKWFSGPSALGWPKRQDGVQHIQTDVRLSMYSSLPSASLCHLERSDGSPLPTQPRFFAVLRMTGSPLLAASCFPP